jgi:hypothetical protein
MRQLKRRFSGAVRLNGVQIVRNRETSWFCVSKNETCFITYPPSKSIGSGGAKA